MPTASAFRNGTVKLRRVYIHYAIVFSLVVPRVPLLVVVPEAYVQAVVEHDQAAAAAAAVS